MKYIGKANKYWTLWEVYEDTRYFRGEPYKVSVHEYLKNISFDLETAKDKYPDAIVDENLHGTSSWESPVASYDKPDYPDDCFQKGKFRGTKIADCKDLEYLQWALGSILHGEAARIAEEILVGHGYRRLNDLAIVDPETAADIDRKNAAVDDAITRIERGEKLTLVADYNPTEEHEIVDHSTGIVFNFPEISVQYYRGYEYYLPVSNGKAKRVKGKTVEVVPDHYERETNRYGWKDRLTVYVKSFKVI